MARKRYLKKEKEIEKKEEEFHIFIKAEFILVKNLKQGPEYSQKLLRVF